MTERPLDNGWPLVMVASSHWCHEGGNAVGKARRAKSWVGSSHTWVSS
jgi:hypothetical protein